MIKVKYLSLGVEPLRTFFNLFYGGEYGGREAWRKKAKGPGCM